MDHFYINIVHRPEMVPEYIQKEAESGRQEDLSRTAVLQESLDIFKLQQQIAHENGLRTTIQMTYASLFNDEAVAIAKDHHDRYGDEIGLTFLGIQCNEFREKFHSRELAIWLFSMEDKRLIVDELFEKFYSRFGFYPTSTGSYYMDAELVGYIKSKFPGVKCAVATCWEEGPKAYWNANNSWYTLMDGGPWNPWIPSRHNIHCPASDLQDDIGIVAIPHLSRDLMAVFDGPGSYYGTHPQNILRGMVYEDDQIPYFMNIVDQYRSMTKYNRGYSYNMMYVGPGWMSKGGRWEANYELLVKSYRTGMEYYGDLKKRGLAVDLTMSEFADVYRAEHTYSQPECTLWKDILYGSNRQMFWYADPSMRVCLDMNQGGAMVDLRPYAARLERPVGVGTKALQDASYPFIIQSLYRSGFFTHYAGEGAVKSCKVRFGSEQVDLCTCRTTATFSSEPGKVIVTLAPVEIEFSSGSIWLESVFSFIESKGDVDIIRRISKSTLPDGEVTIDEYLTGCYGTTEYPEEMTGILLETVSPVEKYSIEYAYQCREMELKNAASVTAMIPQVNTLLQLTLEPGCTGYIREGYAFSPMFTIGARKHINHTGEIRTCLKVEKAN